MKDGKGANAYRKDGKGAIYTYMKDGNEPLYAGHDKAKGGLLNMHA